MIYNQFYSNQNVTILKKIINDDLKSKHNLQNLNINKELNKCMKYVKDNVSSIPPNNMNNDDYLNLMNQKVYNLVIKYYQNVRNNSIDTNDTNNTNDTNEINNKSNTKKVKVESNKIQDKLFDSEIMKSYKNNENIIDYPKPSYNDNNANINNHAEKLKKERDLIYPESKEINFSLDDKDDKNNTVDLYNDLMSSYNQQVTNLENFENNQQNANETIISELNSIEENNESFSNINKLTPITSLSNIETFDNKPSSDNNIDAVYDFQNFLKENSNELSKDKSNIVKPIIENNSNNFSETTTKFKSNIVKEPNYEQSTKTDYIVIDSRYRDFNLYPNQCDFVTKFSPNDNNFIFKKYSENDINIIREKKIVIGNHSNNDVGETFDNVYSVYLDNVISPVHSYEFSTNNHNIKLNETELSLTIYKDSYLLLEIPELRSPYKGGNSIFRKTFAILRIDHGASLTAMTFSNNFTNLIVPSEVMIYEPSTLGKLDKFSIKLNNKNGRIYNFGIDKLYVNNFIKGEYSYLGICGDKEYSTKFEIKRKHSEYSKICQKYYNINNCDLITNNPLVIRDLIYFYHIVPNENELVFFEDDVSIDTFKKNVNNIKISLSYKESNKKINVNIVNMFASFKTINENINNYYFIVIISGDKYYLRVNNIDEKFIYLDKYPNLPTFNKNSVKFGLSKGNKSGSNNDNLESLFYSSGFNVISVENTVDADGDADKYIIEIDFPYNNLPSFIKENNFTDDDLFIIQDKKQISYGFTIKYKIKDYEKLNSNLNESGHN